MTLFLAAGCSENTPYDTAADAPSPAPTIAASAAESTLKRVVLQPEDVGGFTQAAARTQTNDDAARARPDTQAALRQYASWGQVLAYNVQYEPQVTTDLVFTGATARITNTAWIFNHEEGAGLSMAYIDGLPRRLVENFFTNEGAGAKITSAQVNKELAFPDKGDESFAWRLSAKATLNTGLTVNFIADSVFVRAGRITGNVTVVALGTPPDREELVRLIDRFVEKARAAG